MTFSEHRELFKAVMALAAVDGKFARAEIGLLEGLAERVGVGRASLEAMMKSVAEDPDAREKLFSRQMREPARALELLVAAARIDGEVSEDERQLLLHVAEALNVPTEACVAAFERGLATADRLRAERRPSPKRPT